MMKQKLPAALPAVHPAVDQPHETHDLVPASGQQTKQNERERALQHAMALLLSLAGPWPIQMQRNAAQGGCGWGAAMTLLANIIPQQFNPIYETISDNIHLYVAMYLEKIAKEFIDG